MCMPPEDKNEISGVRQNPHFIAEAETVGYRFLHREKPVVCQTEAQCALDEETWKASTVLSAFGI